MGRARTVLVIEDDPPFRLTLAAYLRNLGWWSAKWSKSSFQSTARDHHLL